MTLRRWTFFQPGHFQGRCRLHLPRFKALRSQVHEPYILELESEPLVRNFGNHFYSDATPRQETEIIGYATVTNSELAFPP